MYEVRYVVMFSNDKIEAQTTNEIVSYKTKILFLVIERISDSGISSSMQDFIF